MHLEGVPAVLLGDRRDVDEVFVEAVHLAAVLEDDAEGVRERPAAMVGGALFAVESDGDSPDAAGHIVRCLCCRRRNRQSCRMSS